MASVYDMGVYDNRCTGGVWQFVYNVAVYDNLCITWHIWQSMYRMALYGNLCDTVVHMAICVCFGIIMASCL